MIRLMALLAIASFQVGSGPGQAVDSARFRYILPAGLDGWVCVDFGVAGAPPLKQDAQGVFEIIGRQNEEALQPE